MNSDLNPETSELYDPANDSQSKTPENFPWGWLIIAIIAGLIACLVSVYFLSVYYGFIPQASFLSNNPSVGTPEEAATAFEEKIPFIWDAASDPAIEGTTHTYIIEDLQDEKVLWGWLWCSKTTEDLTDNWDSLELTHVINGKAVQLSNFANLDFDSIIEIEGQGIQEAKCRLNYGILSDWPPGDHVLNIEATFPESINDGWETYPSGYQIINIFNVNVSE